MRERKTIQVENMVEYDSQVNSMEIEGWEVDSKHYSISPNNSYEKFTAFLSREVPDSPPPVPGEDFGIEGYTEDDMWLCYNRGWDDCKAGKPELGNDGLFKEFLDSLGRKSHADPLDVDRQFLASIFGEHDNIVVYSDCIRIPTDSQTSSKVFDALVRISQGKWVNRPIGKEAGNV